MDTCFFIMTGNLTANPEILGEGDKQRVVFSIAAKGLGEEISFFEIQTTGKLAELCNRYLARGARVLVKGRPRQERSELKGKKHSRVVFVADEVQFLSAATKAKEVADGQAV